MEVACGPAYKGFWQDFTIADCFGKDAIEDTYNRAYEEWKDDVVFFTDLVMVLNHKIWQHYQENEELAIVYNDLWAEADIYACGHFTDRDAALYYFQMTD